MNKNMDVHFQGETKVQSEPKQLNRFEKVSKWFGRMIHKIASRLGGLVGRVNGLFQSVIHRNWKFNPSDQSLEGMVQMFETAELQVQEKDGFDIHKKSFKPVLEELTSCDQNKKLRSFKKQMEIAAETKEAPKA